MSDVIQYALWALMIVIVIVDVYRIYLVQKMRKELDAVHNLLHAYDKTVRDGHAFILSKVKEIETIIASHKPEEEMTDDERTSDRAR